MKRHRQYHAHQSRQDVVGRVYLRIIKGVNPNIDRSCCRCQELERSDKVALKSGIDDISKSPRSTGRRVRSIKSPRRHRKMLAGLSRCVDLEQVPVATESFPIAKSNRNTAKRE